jgi:amino acid transporter
VAEPEQRQATRSGPGRVLIAVYAVFALAATARSATQIATKFSDAPLAYVLSAVAAVFYIVATVCLSRGGRTSRQVATVSCAVELVGVIAVGTASVLAPHAFPDSTVWSVYGDGYGFVPVILPILGLLWIRHTARQASLATV